MTTLAEFGARMEHHRIRAGVTNATIADALGVSRQAVGYIQKGRGKTLPGREQIEVIAKLLGVTYETLMGANEDILSFYTAEEQELLKLPESRDYVKLALAKMAEDMRIALEAKLDNESKPKNFDNTLLLRK